MNSLSTVPMKKPSNISKFKLEDLVPLGFDVKSEKAIEIGKQLKDFYFGYTDLRPETILVYLMVRRTKRKQLKTDKITSISSLHFQILSDKHFIHPMHRTVLSRTSDPNSAPTYIYRFNLDSPSYSFVKGIFAAKNVPGMTNQLLNKCLS